MQGDPCKQQHLHHCGVAQLVLHCERDHIEFTHRIAAFVRKQRYPALLHLRRHIRPRRIHAFTPDLRDFVENAAEDPHTEVGHTDLVYVREAERDTHFHLLWILKNAACLAAGISPRFFDRGDEALYIFSHLLSPIRKRGKTCIGAVFPGLLYYFCIFVNSDCLRSRFLYALPQAHAPQGTHFTGSL